MLSLGKDIRTDEPALVDASRSRAVFICGKRGSGKSYTLGALVEELMSTEQVLVIVVDPMGIYHSMAQANMAQERDLWDWGMRSEGYPVRLLAPGDPVVGYGGRHVVDELQRRGCSVAPLRLNPSDLSPDGWCDLFDLNVNEAMGIVLYRAVRELRRQRQEFFYVADIINAVELDGRAQDRTREALLNRLEAALDWGLFSDVYQPLDAIFDPNSVNVIDLSVLEGGRQGLRNLVVQLVARDLFTKRTLARRQEELGLASGVRRVWLMMDEAHQFVPSGGSALAKETIIRWVKEGRQPGLSLVVATQQPAAIDAEVLSQCDVIICHKITNSEDMQALNRLSHDYMGGELRAFIRKLDRRGGAVFLDDEAETVSMIQIRPRKSRHAGGEAAP